MQVKPPPLTFQCGCTIEAKLAFGYERRYVDGQQVCPEHSEPVKGHRSLADRRRENRL